MNPNNWRPDDNSLKQVLNILGLCVRGENLVQREARQKIAQYREHFPHFNNYLVFVLVNGGGKVRPDIRQLAGVLLKNNFKTLYLRNPGSNLNYIKQMLVKGLCDPLPLIRVTCGSAISWFINYHKLGAWPEIIGTLTRLLKSRTATTNAQIGIVRCLQLIVTDNHRDLDDLRDKKSGQTPLNLLIPLFISLFSHQNRDVRKDALSSLILLIDQSILPNGFVSNVKPFMVGLTRLAKDPNPSILKYVCRCFVALTRHPQYLKPIINQVVPFFVRCGTPKKKPTNQNNPNNKSSIMSDKESEKLQFEACEFWNRLCYIKNNQVFLKPLLPYLNKIIPCIISGMVFCEFDRDYIEEEVKRDRDVADFAPRFSKKSIAIANTQWSNNNNNNNNMSEEEEFQLGNYDLGEEWNLRKCSSHAIDVLSQEFKGKILKVSISEIQRRIQTPNCWWIRESGVLALGAICKGCLSLFQKHPETPKMISYLYQILRTDTSPLVIGITLWAVSRFSPIIHSNPSFLKTAIQLTLEKIVSPNMHIQDAACSCLSVFAEEAREKLTPMMTPIVQSLGKALTLYTKKNVPCIYDCVSSLASGMQSRINQPMFFEVLLSPIFKRFEKLVKSRSVNDILISLNECFSTVIFAIRGECKRFASYLWNLNLILVKNTFDEIRKMREKKEFPPNKDIIVSSLDVFNQIVEALGPGAQSLVTKNFLMGLLRCMKEKNTSVRVVTFGLVGDLARNCFGRITPCLDDIVKLLISNLGQNFPQERLTFPILNNSLWSLGRIALQGGAGMVKYLDPIVKQIVIIIKTGRKLKDDIKVNLVVTASRLSISYPKQLSNYFPRFAKEFCMYLPFVKDHEERRHAFQGLCIMLMRKSGTQEGNKMIQALFKQVITAIAYYERPPPPNELKNKLAKILGAYRKAFGQNWESAYTTVDQTSRMKLKESYNFF